MTRQFNTIVEGNGYSKKIGTKTYKIIFNCIKEIIYWEVFTSNLKPRIAFYDTKRNFVIDFNYNKLTDGFTPSVKIEYENKTYYFIIESLILNKENKIELVMSSMDILNKTKYFKTNFFEGKFKNLRMNVDALSITPPGTNLNSKDWILGDNSSLPIFRSEI